MTTIMAGPLMAYFDLSKLNLGQPNILNPLLDMGGLGLMCLGCCRGGQPVRDQEPYFLICYSKTPHHVHCKWAHMNN